MTQPLMPTPAPRPVTVYAIFADQAEADRIARAMIEQQLAACANILRPCRSIYSWQGAIETAEEIPALFKTMSDRADDLVQAIRQLHSYEIPAIIVWPWAGGLMDYGQWVEEATRPQTATGS